MSDNGFTPCRFCGDPVDPGEGDVCNENSCLSRQAFANRVRPIIPPLYAGGFGTFPAHTDAHRALVERGKAWASRFSKKTTTGLYLHGPLGVGKTGFALSILKAVGERGFRVGWTTVAQLLRSYQATYGGGDGSAADIERELLENHLILLDDWGVEKASAWAAESLQMLIDKASANMRPVIIATGNGSLAQIMERYDGGEGRDNMMRALDRLNQIVEVFGGMPGENLRKRG